MLDERGNEIVGNIQHPTSNIQHPMGKVITVLDWVPVIW